MPDAYFARFFPDDGDAIEGYHRVLASCATEARRVLDLGCGDNTDLARYRTAGREVWGTDFRPHPRLSDPTWFRPLRPGGLVPFPDETFDLIGARWVFEHVARPAAFLAEVSRLLRPGGSLVALTVNAAHYVTWLNRLAGRLPHGWTQRLVERLYGRAAHDTFPTVYALNTLAQIRRTARRAGLVLSHVERFANPDYFSFSPTLYRGAVRLDWLLEQVRAGLGRVYVVVTLHKPLGTPGRSAERTARAA